MSLDLTPLSKVSKLLFRIPLVPVQGSRFQPTGFPSLGAATYQTREGVSLLVESPQSMANRLEAVCWDEAARKPKAALDGISFVRVNRHGSYLTSSITEAHRLNSPYLLEGSDKTFFNELKTALGGLADGPIDRKLFAQKLLHYDVGCLLHGVFLAKKELAGGRLRFSRAISAFIEADGVRPAVSGGVKNDYVNPSGDTKQGFGNVPFARDEFTAESISLYVNLDLAQIRGYGLGPAVERLLVLLALWKLRSLLDGALRLRTACDLEPKDAAFVAIRPAGFALPSSAALDAEVAAAIAACRSDMVETVVTFNDKYNKGKGEGKADTMKDDDSDDSEDA